MKKVGLTLGKYAPFHKGHQLVIETALNEVDELIVLIYETPLTPIPLSIRARWIKVLYPQVTVIEAWDGPEGYSSERDFEIEQEQYILKMLNGRKITHFYSSEFYGDHVSKALGAIDRRVDEDKTVVPISATQIRTNPYINRHMVSPPVYQDLIIKIVFMGAMSTGKTTLVKALAEKYHTTWVPEYGREYWANHQVKRRIPLEAFNEIGREHISQENKLILEANKYLFVDTNAITTYTYALDYHGIAPAELTQLAKENAQRYDLFFLCDDDIPYEDTWDRSGPNKRKIFQKMVVADLYERRIPHIKLQGSLKERINKVHQVLLSFRPYSNYFGELNPS